MHLLRILCSAAAASAALLLAGAPGAQDAPLRFLHFSDTHLPRPASEDYVRELLDGERGRGAAFSIHTGDITEFGGRRGAWPSYLALFHGTDLPHYDALGNHDQTWDGLADRLRERFGAPYYRFDAGGLAFFCLNSASYQDPRPSFGEEQLRWLADELTRLPAEQGLVLFLHHPLESDEFATPYEVRRLYALLAGHDVRGFFVGHGHAARSGRFAAWDWVMGGSTFGRQQGHGTCTIDGRHVHYVYTFRDPEREPRVLLDREAPAHEPFALAFDVDRDGDRLRATLGGSGAVPEFAEVRLSVDFAAEPAARGAFGDALDVDVAGLVPGVHVLAAVAALADGREHHRLHEFEVAAPEGSRLEPAWRTRLPAAVQGPMAIAGDVVVAATNLGVLHAFALETGAPLWQQELGGPAPGGVAADGDGGFVAATLDGVVVRVDAGGAPSWRSELGEAVAAAPLVVDGRVVCVDLAGAAHALDAATGAPIWRREIAGWAVEKPPVALDERRAVLGAWDTRVHAFALADGSASWSLPARGARSGAARYYSPADCSPLVQDGRVFVADRKFELTVTDLDGSEVGGDVDVAAITGHAPSHAVYLRRPSGAVERLEGRTLQSVWKTALPVGRTPTPPTADDRHVLAIGERDGVLYLLDAATGAVLDRHRVNPGLYPFCPVALARGFALTGSLDGRLRAFRVRGGG